MAVGSYGNVGRSRDANTSVSIFNIPTLVSTEDFQVLPANTVEFIIKARGAAKIQLAYVSGDSGLLYVTIPRGVSYVDSNFHTSMTVYFQTDIIDVVEIVAFYNA